MKKYLFLFYILLFTFFIFSCQTAKKVEEAEESQIEKQAQLLQNQKQDSLQIAFCECLLDSVNNEQKLETIDNFISQNIDINRPCSLEEELPSNVAETALINMGVSVSNRILRTKFKKKSSTSKTILKSYPILMLFSEDTSMIRQLVSRGANLNIKTTQVFSLPEYYVNQNKLELLKFALSLGAKSEEIEIFTANEKTLDFLIQNGADKNNIDKITLFEKDNYEELAKKYEIDLSKTTCKEFNKIVKVTQFQRINFERTKWLLENKIDVSCINGSFLEDIIDENFDGRIFSTRGKKKPNQHTRKEWIELLENYPVNWNQCLSFGKNPLIVAIEKHDIELIESIIKQKADPNFACEFAGKRKTAKDMIDKKIQQKQENETRKKEDKKRKIH